MPWPTPHMTSFMRGFALAAALSFAACSDTSTDTATPSDTAFNVQRIAHAGGAYNGLTYTNSLEALDHNLAQGLIYFEIDFLFTKDGQLVCMHDWKERFVQAFGAPPSGKPTLSEFETLVAGSTAYKACTLSSLADWMRENPAAYIVTDSKDNNLEALRVIKAVLPDAGTRVIPQIYKPQNYAQVKEMGYEQIIWTLYRYKRPIGKARAVLKWTEKFDGDFAVTMPQNLAAGDLPGLLKDRHIPSYTHTINDPEIAARIMTHFDISEIYTDVLSPSLP